MFESPGYVTYKNSLLLVLFGHFWQTAADNLLALHGLIPEHANIIMHTRDDWGLRSDSDSSEGDDE